MAAVGPGLAFQIGATCFRLCMSQRQASKASLRCGYRSSGDTIPNCLGEFREIRESKQRTSIENRSGQAPSIEKEIRCQSIFSKEIRCQSIFSEIRCQSIFSGGDPMSEHHFGRCRCESN